MKNSQLVHLEHALGTFREISEQERKGRRERLLRYTQLQLMAHGLPTGMDDSAGEFAELTTGLLDNYREKARLLADYRCPADQRIEAFLARHFRDLNLPFEMRLPGHTLVLDRHGIARELSLPVDRDEFVSEYVQSYRVKNGVLHNPRYDRRTTKGTFHIAEGGLPIPGDKLAVPQRVYAELFQRAVQPPQELMQLPFTAGKPELARTFVSLLIRPLVRPAVPGICSLKNLEIRFFAPGGLISNLDFVESIFGNAGDPFLPENDAGLDVEHWTGHTGAVILAPHLTNYSKRELGLPHYDEATDQQRSDGMCWRQEDERYNDGEPFKLTCRNAEGVIVTLIADNYFGYCKKEVKTQISYAANLYGNVEEEHAGGVIAFPSYSLGDEFEADAERFRKRTFNEVSRDFADSLDVKPQGYAIDRTYPDLIYVPEGSRASVREQRVCWQHDGREQEIPLLPGKVYMTPSGYKIALERHPAAPSWRLIGTVGEGVFCHKPCTVSGGGKSEISKPLNDYMLYGPIFVADLERDLDQVQQLFVRDYSMRWSANATNRPNYELDPSRPLLSPHRSLGSVIKLLTPGPDYTDEYNQWLGSLPNHVYALVFIIKRFQEPGWETNWREHFSVDIVNGEPGHELKFRGRNLVGEYLRVGFHGKRNWRTYKLRQDFHPAAKLQAEDDISVSVVTPRDPSGLTPAQTTTATSVKFLANCEYRLFQRPDDAIHRGLDKQTEADLTRGDNFLTNFEPLTRDDVQEMTKYVIDFDDFSPPMQQLLRQAEQSGDRYVVCSANPRKIDGEPSKNPRYLQNRPDLTRPMLRYVAERGMRFARGLSAEKPLHTPVTSVLWGRRNNPPEYSAGIRNLAIYSPIHYQELPELFMDFICSLTGKSPSTTGFGSEGALTKGPFNAVRPTADLNNALVSFILTKLAGFSTSAGYIGPNVRVDHDISLLIPEIWCRLTPQERDPGFLIAEGLLEKLDDFAHDGELILASRLGYRITYRFVRRIFGRIFDNPAKVFDDSILRPETQDLAAFVDGVKYVTEAHQAVARSYFDDGSIEDACPPLKTLLTIMAYGSCAGFTVRDGAVREQFAAQQLLTSDWYRERLETKQIRELALWRRNVEYLDAFHGQPANREPALQLGIDRRRALAELELQRISSPEYVDSLVGTLGADPLRPYRQSSNVPSARAQKWAVV